MNTITLGTESGRTQVENDPRFNAVIPFEGFTRLDANFLYCPNQFLDVCVPNCSRSMVRLVAYFLDQTLGWLDREGNPIAQHITVSYRQLIASGISRGAVRSTIDDAMAAGFIRCVHEGRASTTGEAAEHATYALRWDDQDDYQNSLDNFQGFYAGDGYRTPVPNAFFRHVIPNEPLTVTKVVATVLRHTVGYQNQFGGRRSHAPLAYRFIQEFANISDPKSLSQAISSAIASKYIVCVEEGRFHVDPALRKPASYAVRWLGEPRPVPSQGDTTREVEPARPRPLTRPQEVTAAVGVSRLEDSPLAGHALIPASRQGRPQSGTSPRGDCRRHTHNKTTPSRT